MHTDAVYTGQIKKSVTPEGRSWEDAEKVLPERSLEEWTKG